MVRFVLLKKAQRLLSVIFPSSTIGGRVIYNVKLLEIALLAAVVVDYIDLGVVHNLSCSIFSDNGFILAAANSSDVTSSHSFGQLDCSDTTSPASTYYQHTGPWFELPSVPQRLEGRHVGNGHGGCLNEAQALCLLAKRLRLAHSKLCQTATGAPKHF